MTCPFDDLQVDDTRFGFIDIANFEILQLFTGLMLSLHVA